MPVDLDAAAATLAELFQQTQQLILHDISPPISSEIEPQFDTIFSTDIQSYREALLGIVIVRLQDLTINLRLPYVAQGSTAYHGREIDERVVNPFLQQHRIPSSRGPYLAMFRRNFQFYPSYRDGQRNKPAFDAFLDLITHLENETDAAQIKAFASYLLYRFAKLREAAEVPVAHLQRLSLDQSESLITSLLDTPSGGRLPVFLVVAAFRTIKEYFGLDWVIDVQGINVADAPSGVGGDVTITHAGRIVFAAEITERPLERARVVATFNTKIAPHGIEDYLFFVRPETLAEDTRQQARQYFAQGHEINFLEIRNWVIQLLATMGKRGRDLFNRHLIAQIEEQTVPRAVKVAWNDYIAAITTAS